MGEASNENPQKKAKTENAYYRQKIVKAVEKIDNPAALKRIYKFAEYIYIYKTEKE